MDYIRPFYVLDVHSKYIDNMLLIQTDGFLRDFEFYRFTWESVEFDII